MIFRFRKIILLIVISAVLTMFMPLCFVSFAENYGDNSTDYVAFGTAGDSEVIWRVLEKKADGSLVLITKDIIARVKYNYTNVFPDYETSALKTAVDSAITLTDGEAAALADTTMSYVASVDGTATYKTLATKFAIPTMADYEAYGLVKSTAAYFLADAVASSKTNKMVYVVAISGKTAKIGGTQAWGYRVMVTVKADSYAELPAVDGLTYTANDGTTAVTYGIVGGTVKLNLDESYSQSNVVVKFGGTEAAAADGVYTVGAGAMTVEGVQVNPADYTAYDAAVAKTEGLVAEHYTAETWAALTAALATDVAGLTAVDQAKIDEAAAAIEAAVEGLVLNHTENEDHEYEEIITTLPTCTTAGTKTFTCICGDSYTEVIKATGHSLQRVTVTATCTEDGKDCYQCQNCFLEYGITVIPATGHTEGEWETEIVPACGTDGLMVKKCVSCNTEIDTQTIPATGHTEGDLVKVLGNTCTEDGAYINKCSICQIEFVSQIIPAKGHTLGEWEIKTPAACEEEGLMIKKCTFCKTELESQTIVATGHTHVESITNTPTCSAEGIAEYTCVCGDSYTVTLPIVDHDLERLFTAPSSTEPGFDYYICNFCGNMIGDMAFIPATGFEPANGMVVDYKSNLVYGLTAGVDSLDSYTDVLDGYSWVYELGENGFGTGSKAIMSNGNEAVAEFTVVIFGDVNGDGWYDGNDAFLVNLIVNGMLDRDDVGTAVWTAADCNHDGEINEADYELLMSAGLLLNDIDQSATQVELETNTAYIEYMGLIDQSIEISTDTETNDTNTNDTVGNGLDRSENENDFEIILADIIAFIKQIFSFIVSLIFN